MKNFHLDLVRVTESAAIAAANWVGRGDKESADKAATDAMRDRLNKIDFCAEIAIGEGIKDESFGLYQGELVGCGSTKRFGLTYHKERSETERNTPDYSIAVDPIEGTTPTAKGGYEAMAVIAMANVGCFFKTDAFYMNKLAVGSQVAKHESYKLFGPIGLNRTIEKNINSLSMLLKKPVNHITVCVLDRPRHDGIVKDLRKIGCRIKFITDCDVTACIATCDPDSGIDMYIGVGGAPEAVIAATAVKCMGGLFEAQISDNNGTKFEDRIYSIEELASGDVMFAATGITDGQLLKGIRFNHVGPVTHSIAMRSESGTIRRMITEHGN